jgi:hypothetical protein
MALDTTDFSKFMSELMRILMQQKVRERGYEAWGSVQEELQRSGLARRLEGYEAQEEMQRRLLNAGYSRDVVKMLLATITKGTEGYGRPGIESMERIRQAGLGETPGMPPEIPGQHEKVTEPYANLMPALGRRLEAGKYPSREEMATLTRLLGPEKVQEFLEMAEKAKAGGEQREISREKTKLGYAELGVKKEGKKLTKKQLEDELKFFGKKEKVFVDKLESLEEEIGLTEDDPKAEELKTQISEMRQNQLNTLDQLLGDLDKKKCDGIISKLTANQITAKGMEKYKEKFIKEYKLTDEEYQYIRLNL